MSPRHRPSRPGEAAIGRLNSSARRPLVAILMGSESDVPAMTECVRVLQGHDVPYDVRVLSAHRTPSETERYVRGAERRGVRVLIAGAGASAHLAGVTAAHTRLPVIGVPLAGSPLGGIDALLSTVQMPPGIPVATVGVGSMGAKNAAHLAIRILALLDPGLGDRLRAGQRRMKQQVLDASTRVRRQLRKRLDD